MVVSRFFSDSTVSSTNPLFGWVMRSGLGLVQYAVAATVGAVYSGGAGQATPTAAAGRQILNATCLTAATGTITKTAQTQLVNPTELIVANKDSKFGIPEVKRGLAAAAGGLVRLPRQIPQRLAMELALTGEFISAPRAYEMGLINRVVDGVALEGALQLAEAISANGPLAVAASKQVIREQQDWSQAEQWKNQYALTAKVFTSSDAREGAAAFAQKRAPNWTGS
jgi:enoyl-CoA hydratase